jgi:hypothetical protein
MESHFFVSSFFINIHADNAPKEDVGSEEVLQHLKTVCCNYSSMHVEKCNIQIISSSALMLLVVAYPSISSQKQARPA